MLADEPRTSQGVELRRVARSVGEVHVLLVLLTLVYWFAVPAMAARAVPWFLALAAFGAAILTLRRLPPLAGRPRLRLAWEASAMVVFITVLVFLTGNSSGPLLHLYLLPVITVALVLGREATLFQLGLIVACRILGGVLEDGADWFSLATAMALFAELSPTGLAAFLTCALVADRELADRRLRTLSERDHLTGLYDLRTLSQRLEAELSRGGGMALLKIDLDRLKQLNDRFGHQAGDRALVTVAEAIRRATRDPDICGRFGGDEFMVALPGADEDSAEIVANRIRHNVYAATQDFDYAMRRLSVNVGIAFAPEDGRDFRSLVQAADRAMLEDQARRRSRETGIFGAPGSSLGT